MVNRRRNATLHQQAFALRSAIPGTEWDLTLRASDTAASPLHSSTIDIKIRVGSAFPDDAFDQESMDVRGLHLLSGLPRTINLKAGDLREAIAEPLNVIVEAVKRTLERTPPELAADIVDRGIMLAGGGALVRGISDLISHETGIFTHIAEDPLLCVVNGCGQVLEDYKRLQRVLDTPEYVRNTVTA